MNWPDPQPTIDPPEVQGREPRDFDAEFDAARDLEDEEKWIKENRESDHDH